MNRFMRPKAIGLVTRRGPPDPPFDAQDFYERYPQFFHPKEPPGMALQVVPAVLSVQDVGRKKAKLRFPGGRIADMQIRVMSGYVDIAPRPIIPQVLLDEYIKAASAAIRHSLYQRYWAMCMGFFVAHFVTMYLNTFAEIGESPQAIAEAGTSTGDVTSKSVGPVSVGYGSRATDAGFDGFGCWLDTEFGRQLAAIAKMLSVGGIYVRGR